MDLIDVLKGISSKIESQKAFLTTEEATKNALILPVLAALGYNVFDPTEVVPEFTCDVGTKKGEKVDYALIINGQPLILIECKQLGTKLSINQASQLFRYFAASAAKFGVLTNGVDYLFYTDIEAANKMDEKPFFEMNMLQLEDSVVNEFKKFSKATFDLDAILNNASELKYTKQIQKLVEAEIDSPSEELVRIFIPRVYEGKITAQVREQFKPLVANAFRQAVKDRVNERIKSALECSGHDEKALKGGVEAAPVNGDSEGVEKLDKRDVVTTDEEREGLMIVRALLGKTVRPDRIVMRDAKSYCAILLDDNNRKPVCRLWLDRSQKYVSLFDKDDKKEDRVPIESLFDLYGLESRLVEAITRYEQ
ncbi:MAG: type I restriction enzyme HsdR N-terminal domain-containing protein [Opitutales bacterium]|nr:type I restriction enzyme HsdR N-terminal domain-containing protein [Opitutales bacterium]